MKIVHLFNWLYGGIGKTHPKTRGRRVKYLLWSERPDKWEALRTGSNPDVGHSINNLKINIMVKKVVGDWTQSLREMKVGDVIEIPIGSYDVVMNTTKYRVKRSHGFIFEREGEFDYEKRTAKIKRTA